MADHYKEGKMWVESNIPLYLGQLQPYYLLAEEKALQAKQAVLQGYEKAGVLAKAGVDQLEKSLPGTRKKIEDFGELSHKFIQAILVKTQQLATNAQQVAIEILK